MAVSERRIIAQSFECLWRNIHLQCSIVSAFITDLRKSSKMAQRTRVQGRARRRILFYTVKFFFMNNTRSISAINLQKHLLSNKRQHIGALEHGMTSESTLQNDFRDNRPAFLSDTSTHQTTDSIYFPFHWATLSSYR